MSHTIRIRSRPLKFGVLRSTVPRCLSKGISRHSQPIVGRRSVVDTPLVLHLGQSTVELPFSPDEARNLGRSFNALLQTFKDKQESPRPQKWEIMEYVYQGEDGVERFEVTCNPNAFPTAFDAKLMVDLRAANGIRFAGEGELSQIKSDLADFISNHITEKQ